MWEIFPNRPRNFCLYWYFDVFCMCFQLLGNYGMKPKLRQERKQIVDLELLLHQKTVSSMKLGNNLFMFPAGYSFISWRPFLYLWFIRILFSLCWGDFQSLGFLFGRIVPKYLLVDFVVLFSNNILHLSLSYLGMAIIHNYGTWNLTRQIIIV